ncbi:hypothetical protein [Amycolatopsis benzoatilytica]|uniref:hypothetical protein n=1 Tax=Amycolatopsis benzoatilytica TaxID=346045 RepID=UPI00036A5B40|nr:hypothetical protein [Amycolatopsis benzoatilytica]
MTTAVFAWDRPARAVLVDALARLDGRRFAVETRPGELVIARTGRLRHDDGRLVLAGCGAALSTAWIVLRVLGVRPRLSLPHDPERPDVVAVVTAGGDEPARARDWDRYLALRAVRGPASGQSVPVEGAAGELSRENHWPHTRVLPPRQAGSWELAVVADGTGAEVHVLLGAAVHSLRVAAAVRGWATEARAGLPGGAPHEVLRVFES